MKYKAIITDLDGTALDSPEQKVSSQRLALAVSKLEARGIKVCAATGRAESFAYPVLASMQLTQPAIIAGGTRIIEPVKKNELWCCGLSSSQMHEIVLKMKKIPYKFLWNDSTEDDYLNGGWSIQDYNSFEDTYFFEICFVPQSKIEEILTLLKNIDGIAVTVVVSQRANMNDIHITNRLATKEHAIYELEKIIGVEKSEMIGVGGGHNDLHLFSAVGYKVAMGNAVSQLKAAADEVIDTVQDDGLALYFERLEKEME